MEKINVNKNSVLVFRILLSLIFLVAGFNHILQIFDDNLWEKESVELQFEKKRIDAVITNQTVGSYVLSKTSLDKSIEILEIENYSIPTYLAFRKGTIDINIINTKMLKLLESPDTKTIYNQADFSIKTHN